MKRVENSLRNLRYGIVFQLVDIILKFIMRTALVKLMGDAVVGLNGLFTEVLAMLALAELGVGSAITYSLYKPLAEQDEEKIASLMALFQRAYRLIALAIFLLGLALLPFIHLLVSKVDFSLSYIRLVYFLFLLSTAVSYLFSYKSALFTADQKAYKATRINMITELIIVLVKTSTLIFFHSFVAFLVAEIIGRIVTNLLINASANRAYPFLRQKAAMPEKAERRLIFRNIGHLFIGKLSGKITNSTDNTLISVMDSTISVGLYSNYSMVLNNARSFLGQFTKATAGSIGNLLATESGDRCYSFLKRLTMLMFTIGSVMCVCFYVGLSPFINVWLGSSRVLSDSVLTVLTLNFFFYAIREPLWQFMSVSGLFAKDKNISLTGTAVNLFLSILLGLKWGMLGIFIGTTSTLVIQYILKARLLCRECFHVSPAGFYAYTALFLLSTAASAVGLKALCSLIVFNNPWLELILRVVTAALITLGVDLILFFRTDEMRYYRALLIKRLAGRLPFLHRK